MIRSLGKRFIQDEGQALIARQLWEQRALFWRTVIFCGCAALLEGLGIGLLVPFLENITNPENQKAIRTGWTWLDTHVIALFLGEELSAQERLYRISGLLLTTILIRLLFGYIGRLNALKLQEASVYQIRRSIHDQLQSISLSFFSTARTGELMNTLTTEIQRLRFLFQTSAQVLIQILFLLIYVGVVLLLSWQMALLAFVFCILTFVALAGLIERLKQAGKAITKTNGEIASVFAEFVAGIRTIQASGSQDHESAKFDQSNRASRDAVVEAGKKNALVYPLSQSAASMMLIAVIVTSVQFFVLPGLMSVSVLLAFLFAIFRLLPLVNQLNVMRGQWANQRGSIENVSALLRTEDKPYLPNGTEHFGGLRKGGIRVDNLSFAYSPGGDLVLRNVNLDIPQGTVTAFVGSSGAGKSTLADLIVRFYDPTEGTILFDGKDLRTYDVASLREQIAVVSQETFLFNDSVRNNIAYGLQDVSDEAIRAVAQQANALEFIENLPKGFDTVLGERGARLSGGQRQRIAIARALLRDPDILVLDEATSALDSVSERLVQESLEYLMEGRTVIIIAHRLSTIEHADNVVVLEDGRIVEQGTYQELIGERGQFWEYHALQLQLS